MRILVVDDNDQMREMLRLILETAGHEVLDAANGKIALHLLKTMTVDLVITDIIMPEMEGIELVMNIHKLYPRVKIIAISGGGKVDPNLCLGMAGKLGADRTLLKPFSKSTLISIIGELFPDSNLHNMEDV
ncbi:MAG: response regulator [Syntrophales bacterium]